MLRYNQLAQAMDELALHSDAERRASLEKSEQVQAEFKEGLNRIEVAVEQLEALFNSDANGLSQGKPAKKDERELDGSGNGGGEGGVAMENGKAW